MQPNGATIIAGLPASMRGRLSVCGVTVDCYRGARGHGVNFDAYGQTREGTAIAWVPPALLPTDWDKEKTAELDGRMYRIEDAHVDNNGVFVRFTLVKPLKDADHP